jgi:diguanylate cyclase (GGDEF)-like protein
MFIIMFGMWIGTGSVHPLFIAYAMMVVQVFLLTTDKSKRVYLLTAFIFSYLTLGFIDVFIRNIQIGTIGNLNIQSLISIASILLGSLLILHFNNIEVEELNSEIASIGFEDALTSAMNRHAFFEDIKRVESNHLNYKRDYAIVYMDVDDLKIINDSYGHAEGDKAIRTVVDVTKGLLRSNDGLYRFGGDEFVLLLENMDEKQLIHKLSEIDSKLLRHSGKYALSVSYGHAHRNNVFSYEAAMKIADTNMYKSKAHKKKYHKSIYANN